MSVKTCLIPDPFTGKPYRVLSRYRQYLQNRTQNLRSTLVNSLMNICTFEAAGTSC